MIKDGDYLKINEVNYKWNGSLIKRKKTDMIILHHAAAKECSPEAIHQWHLNNGWSGIGYAFIIRKNGKIYRGRPEDTVGAHTSNFNATSIGICFEGDFRFEKPTDAQVKAGKELVAYLKQKYNMTQVKRHCDLNNTSCPGRLFPFDEIANMKVEENLVLSFQKAAEADGFKFKQYGVDGIYGVETKAAMQKCVVKRRLFYQYKNCTKLVQRLLGIKQDGLCGPQTSKAIEDFQRKNNLLVDGCCGLKTWQKLLNIN